MNKAKTQRIALACILLMSGLMATAAYADRGDWHHWHGPERHFDGGGRWYHGDHDGRLGWWWITGPGLWYFYTRPYYPYPYPYGPYNYYGYPNPNPPVVVVPSQPTMNVPPREEQYWYYCDSARAYYPYVSSCPGGWRKVPATPPAPPGH